MKAKTNRRLARKRHDYWHKQFHILGVGAFNLDVALAVNMTEDEVLSRMVRIVNKHHMESTEQEGDCLESLIGDLRGWDRDIHAEGRACRFGPTFVVLLRTQKNAFRSAMGILVHEMVHVVQYLLRDRRIPLSPDTDEVHAYLTQHLVKSALSRLYS